MICAAAFLLGLCVGAASFAFSLLKWPILTYWFAAISFYYNSE